MEEFDEIEIFEENLIQLKKRDLEINLYQMQNDWYESDGDLTFHDTLYSEILCLSGENEKANTSKKHNFSQNQKLPSDDELNPFFCGSNVFGEIKEEDSS